MLSLRWFRRQRRPAPTFRPALLLLEDRTVPSASAHSFSHLPVPGPATHLQVIVPEQVQSGRSFQVEVEAEDASNQLATGYTGTVTFTLVPADTGATLPANYTFTSSDHGKHLFQVTLVATGSPTITVTDTTTSTITGSASTVVNPAPVATTLEVVTPEQAAMGVATCVTVEVLDQSGHIMTNFTGAVTLSSSDTTATGTSARHTTAASLPITYTFTASDHGKHTFQVTFKETAAATGTSTTVTAATSTLSGSASLTVYPATVVTHFGLLVRSPVVTGSAASVTVEALNASNQVVSGYTGTVSFTSSDTTATASATKSGTATSLSSFTYTFTSGDAGRHQFWLNFDTTGQQSLTVTDNTTPSPNTGTVNIDVLTPPQRKHWGSRF